MNTHISRHTTSSTSLRRVWSAAAGLLPFILILAVLSACSNSPSSDAENVLRAKIDSQSGGGIKLVAFKKTDGQSQTVGNVEAYVLQFTADIEFEKDGTWLNSETPGTVSFSIGPAEAAGSVALVIDPHGHLQVAHGMRASIAGTIDGTKTEKGWQMGLSACHIVSDPVKTAAQPVQMNPQAQLDAQLADKAKRDRAAISGGGQANAVSPEEAERRCINNLVIIYGAKAQWALVNKKEEGAVPTFDEIIGVTPQLAQRPVCPAGGVYTVGPIGSSPTCSVAGHTLP